MTKSPRKIGILISGGNPWEAVLCFLHLEKKGFLRLPITIHKKPPSEFEGESESELSRLTPVYIEDVKATAIDGLIIPGGVRLFDALCDFNNVGDALKVDENLKALVKGIYRLEKPIGAFGAASLLVAKALQGITHSGLVVTVGNNPKLQSGIEITGAQAVITRPGEVVLDESNKVITSGGELSSKRPTEVSASCENLLSGLEELIKIRKNI